MGSETSPLLRCKLLTEIIIPSAIPLQAQKTLSEIMYKSRLNLGSVFSECTYVTETEYLGDLYINIPIVTMIAM